MKRFFALAFCFVAVATTSAGFPRIFGSSPDSRPRPAPESPPAAGIDVPDPAAEAMRKYRPSPRQYRSVSASVIPSLSVPDVIAGEVDDFIEVAVDTNCDGIVFYPITKGLRIFPRKFLNQDVAKNATIVIAKTEGDYAMIVVGALGGQIAGPAEFIVRVGHAPQPPPGPGPNPPPDPPDPPPAPNPPATAALTIISIDNATARTKPISDFIGADSYWAGVKAAGHSFWLMDSNNAAQTTKYAAQIASVGGAPAVIIMDSARKVLGVVAYPKDATGKPAPSTAWLSSLLAKYGGVAPQVK